MERLINDFIAGVIVLAFFGGIHGFTKLIGEKAARAHENGLMSYSQYTKMLTK
jgi:hypothetical protein